jgi:flagellar biosynthetic protein FlhB
VLVATVAIRSTGALAAARIKALWPIVAHAIARPDEATDRRVLSIGLSTAFTATLPLALVLVASGIVVNLSQVGLAFSTQPLRPKLSRLNPFPGIKRLFQPTGLWDTAKSLAKVVLLGGLGWQAVSGFVHRVADAGHLATLVVAGMALDTGLRFVRTCAAIGLVLAFIDYAVNRRKIGKSLRMSKQEIKEEGKQSEGNPEVKGHIKGKMRQLSRQRSLQAIERADAIIVNPTHLAIAIQYVPGTRAPKVVAMGAGELATRMRALAAEHRIPIVRDVPLARTLWKLCDVGDEVPPQLFEAVAHVLAFVYGLRRTGRVQRLDGAPHELAGGSRLALTP